MDRFETMRAFTAVAEAGSFTKAADSLGWSKAAVSKYVAALEDRLEVRLLNRTTRRLSLTEAGKAYLERARSLLDQLGELEAAVQDQQSRPRGLLRITGPQTFGEVHLAGALSAFAERYPDIEIDLVLADRFVDVVEDGFDLAVRIADQPDTSLIARRLAPCDIILAAAPSYLAAAGSPKALEDLARHSLILDSNFRGGPTWTLRDAGGKEQRVGVEGRIRVNGATAVREMLLAGAGIAMVPLFAVESDVRAGRLVRLLPGSEVLQVTVQALYPHARHLSAKVRACVDFLAERYRGARWQVDRLDEPAPTPAARKGA